MKRGKIKMKVRSKIFDLNIKIYLSCVYKILLREYKDDMS